MHEYAIVESLVRRVEETARERAGAVRSVTVRLGELAGVEPDLLCTAYEAFRAGTVCAGAELRLERVAARWSCRRCAREIPPGELLRCPECRSPARLEGGDEIVLARIELEVP